MARRLLVLLLPLVLLAGACSSDDDPQDGSAETTAPSSTDSSASSTTRGTPDGSAPSVPGSTTTPAGPAISMTGDGTGSIAYSLATDRSEFCYRITVEDGGTATEAHVHRGGDGETGEVVLNLTPPAEDGTTNTCSATDTLLIGEIEAEPGAFYVDVHTADGDLRAQLR